jgi:PAS domain S-box-containing protein
MTVRDQQIVTAAFDQASEAMMITDAAEKVVRINRQFTALTGYDPSEITGQTPAILRSGKNEPHLFNEFWNSLNSSGRWQGEIWNRKKNGRLFVADLTVSAVLNHYGKVSYYLAVYRDITAVKEDQLKQQMRDNR